MQIPLLKTRHITAACTAVNWVSFPTADWNLFKATTDFTLCVRSLKLTVRAQLLPNSK